ncbi:MAG: YaeQ family protein [Bdellovibrionaceae bacterium]|nr:YaeQ family protein [Pseudobdellovibrionaceae bacterium]
MALPSKLYRFKIELSDMEKSVYESLDFRVAQHPSESLQFLLTRVLAYALSYEPELEFSSTGLADPDAPCLSVPNPQGGVKVWIEIGNPSARKVHKASKAALQLKIFTYKDPQPLLADLSGVDIHRKKDIEIYSISSKFLDKLALQLKKDNRWTLMFTDGTIMINSDDMSEQTELVRHQ